MYYTAFFLGDSEKLERKSKPADSPRQKRGRSHSLADLLKPSRNAVKDALSRRHSNTGAEGTSYFGLHDLLGVLRVRAKGTVMVCTSPQELRNSDHCSHTIQFAIDIVIQYAILLGVTCSLHCVLQVYLCQMIFSCH